jgi:hypothetical protein
MIKIGKDKKIKPEGRSKRDIGKKIARDITKEKTEREKASSTLIFKPESHIACSNPFLKF